MPSLTAYQQQQIAILEDIATRIQNTQINIKKLSATKLTEGYMKARMKSIEGDWTKFKEAHYSLIKSTPGHQRRHVPYFVNEDYSETEELYHCLQGEMIDLLSKIQEAKQLRVNFGNEPPASLATHGGQFSSLSNLPRLQLPKYSGKLEDWPTFENLFLTLVHKAPLSNVQKLYYLKSSVSEQVEIMLHDIQFTDENNYERAWQILKNQFGNKNMIVSSILKTLFGQREMSNQSASNTESIYNTTTECIDKLNKLNINTDSWDPLIVFLVSQKLSTDLLCDWEKNLESNNEVASWQEMKHFLKKYFGNCTGFNSSLNNNNFHDNPEWCIHLYAYDTKPSKIIFSEKCFNCSHTDNNWVCLHCYITLCSRYDNGHMLAHFNATKHTFVYSLTNADIWCYLCEKYVNNSKFHDVKDHIQSYQRLTMKDSEDELFEK